MYAMLLAAALCAPHQDGHHWHQDPGFPQWWSLSRHDRHLGWWNEGTGVYRPGNSGALGRPCAPPVDAPFSAENFGVRMDAAGKGLRYTRKGVEVSREEALEAVSGGPVAAGGFGQRKPLPDRAKSRRVVVVGPEARRLPVVKALEGEVPKAAPDALIDHYDASHWAVAGKGYVAPGKDFAVLVQSPSGGVLHRQDDEADALKGVLEALRDPRPDYDSRKDPDRRKAPLLPISPSLPALPGVPALPAGTLAGGGVLTALLAYALLRRPA